MRLKWGRPKTNLIEVEESDDLIESAESDAAPPVKRRRRAPVEALTSGTRFSFVHMTGERAGKRRSCVFSRWTGRKGNRMAEVYDEDVKGPRRYREEYMSEVIVAPAPTAASRASPSSGTRCRAGSASSARGSTTTSAASVLGSLQQSVLGCLSESPLQVDKQWLGCDACGEWHECNEQQHDHWSSRRMTSSDLGAVCKRPPRKEL